MKGKNEAECHKGARCRSIVTVTVLDVAAAVVVVVAASAVAAAVGLMCIVCKLGGRFRI